MSAELSRGILVTEPLLSNVSLFVPAFRVYFISHLKCMLRNNTTSETALTIIKVIVHTALWIPSARRKFHPPLVVLMLSEIFLSHALSFVTCSFTTGCSESGAFATWCYGSRFDRSRNLCFQASFVSWHSLLFSLDHNFGTFAHGNAQFGGTRYLVRLN